MKSLPASFTRVALTLLGVVVAAFVISEGWHSHRMSVAVEELDSFRNSVATGTSQVQLIARAKQIQKARITSTDGAILVSLYTCHCTFHVAQGRVVSTAPVICNA